MSKLTLEEIERARQALVAQFGRSVRVATEPDLEDVDAVNEAVAEAYLCAVSICGLMGYSGEPIEMSEQIFTMSSVELSLLPAERLWPTFVAAMWSIAEKRGVPLEELILRVAMRAYVVDALRGVWSDATGG